jgi:hypothetical protein
LFTTEKQTYEKRPYSWKILLKWKRQANPGIRLNEKYAMNISYLKDNETIKQKLEDDFLKFISSVQSLCKHNTKTSTMGEKKLGF